MFRRDRWRPLMVMGALIATGAAISARAIGQAPVGSDILSPRAVAESLKVLGELRHSTEVNAKDVALWHHRGMIALALAARAKVMGAPKELRYLELRNEALDAFQAALNLDPDNAERLRALARYHVADGTPNGYGEASILLERAYAMDSSRVTDATDRAHGLLEMARVPWLAYDYHEGRALSMWKDEDPVKQLDASNPNQALGRPADAAPNSVGGGGTRTGLADSITPDQTTIGTVMNAALERVLNTLNPVRFEEAGEVDYLRAGEWYRKAYAVAPADSQVFRELAMYLLARDNWSELGAFAREHVRRARSDGWGWMALGLSKQRLGERSAARELFDTALARLDKSERARLDRLERVLRPTDSATFRQMDSTKQAGVTGTSWLLANPLWSSGDVDPRVEFLARVTFAELRWSVPGTSIRGADTDRGDIYVRYGPPDKMLAHQEVEGYGWHAFWVYLKAGLVFDFDKYAYTGIAHIPPSDIELVERAKEWQPARWDNIADVRVDSMPTQMARFRAGRDSVDMFLAMRAPIDSMRNASVSNVPATAHFWLYGWGTPYAYVDSVPVGASGNLEWTRRVEAGPYYYRVESTIPTAKYAGRSAARTTLGADAVTGFSLLGFGISDVVLATKINVHGTAQRWIDYDFTPLLGDVPRGSELQLLWETYELTPRDNAVDYGVTITIERERSDRGKIAAQVVGRLAGAVGINTSANKVEMKFDRKAPYAPILAENVTIALGVTPAGSYRMTVAITDHSRGVTTSRTMPVTIK